MRRSFFSKRARIAAVATAAVVALAPVADTATAAEPRPLEKKLRRLINEYRTDKGRKALKMNDTLVGFARKHSKKMANEGRLSHSTVQQMTNYWDKANCKFFRTNPIAELVADSKPKPHDVEDLLTKWQGSGDHNKQLLLKKWRKLGSGVVRDGKGVLWGTVLLCG